LGLKEQLHGMSPPDSAFDPPWTTVNVGALHGGSVHDVIAPKAQVDWEMRPVQHSNADFVKSHLYAYCHEVLLPKMRAVYPEASIETEVVGEVEGLVPTLENETLQIVSELTGTDDASLMHFGTEGGIFKNIGMDVVVCGPGSIEQAHKADEFVTVSQLESCTAMLSKLSKRLGR
jgi:acetylornithine deacetylase